MKHVHVRRRFLQKVSLAMSLFLLLFSSLICLFAQKTFSKSPNAVIKWQLDATVKGVEFYHALLDCNGKKAVFLKINNRNNSKVEVSWKESFTTQEGPRIEGYFGKKNMVLNTGEVKETDCNNPTFEELLILPGQVNPTYVADISGFYYKDMTVTDLK